MTLAEILIFLVVAGTLYAAMRPLQKRLEARLYKVFRAKYRSNEKPVIDITVKKEK